jgi:plasmid replication initiation protein
MAATPYEILTFVGRSDSGLSYDRLKAALDRLQSTTVVTSIRQPSERRRHRFSWINEWKERLDATGRPLGIELILPDWFYAGVLDDALILTIDRAYFHLTGGSSAGCIASCASMAAGRRTAGASISRTCI